MDGLSRTIAPKQWAVLFGVQLNQSEASGVPSRRYPAPVAESSSELFDAQLAIGWDHRLCLDQGSVLARGWNAEGQADPSGSKRLRLDHWTPVGLHQATAISAGERHSCALTADGTVWTWGSNSDGQLGQSTVKATSPQPVLGPAVLKQAGLTRSQCRSIACGARHTAAVARDGSLFCWGWNAHGQCGRQGDTSKPGCVLAMQGLQCCEVAAGLAHTLVCTDAGACYSWGWNADGQLGLGHQRSCREPSLIEAEQLAEEHVTQVSCGARHSAVVTQNCHLFCWGMNKWGQLGLGHTNMCSEPQPVSLPVDAERLKGLTVRCGWWHTACWADNKSSDDSEQRQI